MTLYSIKDVSGGQYKDGFFTALRFFDKKVCMFLKSRGLYIEFINYLAEQQKKHLNTQNSKEVKKQ